MCLDADLNTAYRNGGIVQLWQYNGQPQQRWEVYGNGVIKNIKFGRVVDANANAIGTYGNKVQLWDYRGTSNQIWTH